MSQDRQVKSIPATATYALRHRVLRPNQTLDDCKFALDEAVDTLHAGCFVAGELVGIGTIFREDREGRTDREVWRIRGMAVAPEYQGQGLGARVLDALISYAQTRSPQGEVWCNGRAHVRDFYRKAGFVQVGDVFDLPPIGPHVVMLKTLQGA